MTIQICNLCEKVGFSKKPVDNICTLNGQKLDMVTDFMKQFYILTPNNCPLLNSQSVGNKSKEGDPST